MAALDYDALHTAMVAVFTGWSWTKFSPAPEILKGARLEVDQDGPVVIVEFGRETPAKSLHPGNLEKKDNELYVLGGVPWQDTQANVKQRNDMWTELSAALEANRNAGGMVQWKSAGVQPLKATLAGPSARAYRAVVFTLSGLNFRQP